MVKELFDEYKEEQYGLPVQWLQQAITSRFNPPFPIDRFIIKKILKRKKMLAQNVRPSIPIGKKPNAYDTSDHIAIYDKRKLYGSPYKFTTRQWGL